jgi:hypothetical protein
MISGHPQIRVLLRRFPMSQLFNVSTVSGKMKTTTKTIIPYSRYLNISARKTAGGGPTTSTWKIVLLPRLLEAVSLTVYVPAEEYVWFGWPRLETGDSSPKSQEKLNVGVP